MSEPADAVILDCVVPPQMDERVCVAVRKGRIVQVGGDTPEATHIFHADGGWVLPGLIDVHVHVFKDFTPWGIDIGGLASRTGVTTVVDAGSAGAATVHGLRRIALDSREVRILALLNLSRIGLAVEYGELANEEFLNVDLAEEVVRQFPGWIVGVKARLNADTTGRLGGLALERAVELANRVKLPLMVDIYDPPPTLEEILERLRPGDILTHCCVPAGNSPGISKERLNLVKESQDRGVLFDVGHGMASFSFQVAEAMCNAGIYPDTISSDLHRGSVMGPAFDLLTTMAKFVIVGMPIPEVLRAVTTRPRQVLLPNDEERRIASGYPADLAVLRLGRTCEFMDVEGETRNGTSFECLLTLREGIRVYQNPTLSHRSTLYYPSSKPSLSRI